MVLGVGGGVGLSCKLPILRNPHGQLVINPACGDLIGDSQGEKVSVCLETGPLKPFGERGLI